MGLDGETKMSKSRDNQIGLFDQPDEVMGKLRGAKTDPQRLRRADPGDPGVCNVFSYHGFFTDEPAREQIGADCRNASIGCVDCKKILAANIENEIGPVRERAAELRRDPAAVDEILAAGGDKARAEAAQTMELVRDSVGL